MKKKRSRKMLIEEIKRLRAEVSSVKSESAAREKALRDRIDMLGLSVNTPVVNGIGFRTIEAEPFGTYMYVVDGLSAKDLEYAKKHLAERLVKALMDQQIIQFIYKRPKSEDPLYRASTLGAKIYVVPWDQMAPGQRTRTVIFTLTGKDGDAE